MRRMIPQKLIDELVARLEREEQTKEMLKNITIEHDSDISAYYINLASDGETYLTITGWADVESTDACTIELHGFPSEFLSKLHSAGDYLGTNSLDGAESVLVEQHSQLGFISITFFAGENRTVFSTITLSSAFIKS